VCVCCYAKFRALPPHFSCRCAGKPAAGAGAGAGGEGEEGNAWGDDLELDLEGVELPGAKAKKAAGEWGRPLHRGLACTWGPVTVAVSVRVLFEVHCACVSRGGVRVAISHMVGRRRH
jgi:hypothetical protein